MFEIVKITQRRRQLADHQPALPGVFPVQISQQRNGLFGICRPHAAFRVIHQQNAVDIFFVVSFQQQTGFHIILQQVKRLQNVRRCMSVRIGIAFAAAPGTEKFPPQKFFQRFQLAAVSEHVAVIAARVASFRIHVVDAGPVVNDFRQQCVAGVNVRFRLELFHQPLQFAAFIESHCCV